MYGLGFKGVKNKNDEDEDEDVVAWRGVAWRGVAWRGVAWRECLACTLRKKVVC